MLVHCSRCSMTLDYDKFFQPPVTLCLICYSRIPTNQDIDISTIDGIMELRKRAVTSRSARMKAVANQRSQFFKKYAEEFKLAANSKYMNKQITSPGFADMEPVLKEEIVLQACDRCKEEVDSMLLEMRTPHDAWCRSCIQKEDEKEANS